MRAVAAIPALGLLAGCASGLIFPELPLLIGVAAMLACAGLALVAWHVSASRALALAVALACAAGGALLASDAWREAWRPSLRVAFDELARAERAQAAAEKRVIPEDDQAFATVTGVLRADASPGASSVSLSVAVDGLEGQDGRSCGHAERGPETPCTGGILVSVVGSLGPERLNEWRAGRRVRLPVELRRTSRYLDPGVPDLERALARRGTTLVGTVKSAALVEVIGRGSWWDEAVAGARARARRAIADAVGPWSARSAAIVAAIVIGDRAGLDQEVQRRLQEAGTFHVIAISGGNIAILAGLLLGAFRMAGLLGRGAMLAAILGLTAYAALVGGGASVDRATLMATLYFGGRMLDQRSPPLNTLAVVAALLVASGPLEVADPAFVLTFGATLAILVAVPVVPIAKARGRRKRFAPVVAMFAASLAAETALFPVGALVFSRVTFAGLALNFLAIPLMGVAQVAGMVVVPCALVSARLAAAAGWVAHLGAEGLVASAGFVRFVPALTYRVAPPGAGVVAIYYVALTASWVLWRRRATECGSVEPVAMRRCRRGACAVSVAAGLWMLAQPWAILAARGDGRLHFTFIDVGQGDSIFVRFPRGSTLLVDAGGLSTSSGFDIGDRVVAPVLREQGVRRLDVLALTHGDPDHIGGAGSIIREFRPREVWEGIPVPRFQPLTALRLQTQAAGERWANVYAGRRITLDGVDLVVRNPTTAEWERQKVRNDDSLAIEIRWRDVSVLLTGDMGRAVERPVAGALEPAPLRVIKVPHHGSLTSSSVEFIRAVHPQLAVVSVGRGNHFGHPVPAVLQRYRDEGAEIFRTDEDGAVMLDTDGRSVDVHSFSGRRLALK